MVRYMHQFSYSTDSAKAMLEKPQDRRAAAEELLAAAGGKLHDFYFSFGDYDGIVISEFPTHVDAASVGLAIAASGGIAKFKTTVLISPDDGMAAMDKAGKVAKAYKPPAG